MKKQEFINLVCQALGLGEGSLNENSSVDNTPEWDSLGIMSIVALIDSTFNVTMSADEVKKMGSIRELVGMLQEKKLIE